MKITSTVRFRALVLTLYALRVDVGGRVFLHDLNEVWRRVTGLRQSDLHLTLGELVGNGDIRRQRHADGTLFELTRDGARHLVEKPLSLCGLFALARAQFVLMKTRRRYAQGDGVPSSAGRRATDLPLVA